MKTVPKALLAPKTNRKYSGKVEPRPSVVDPSPNYLRIAEASYRFGLSRTHLFALIARGEIKSIHLKRPEASRGIRLIETESLKEYVESFA
jgi:hypothetical protein